MLHQKSLRASFRTFLQFYLPHSTKVCDYHNVASCKIKCTKKMSMETIKLVFVLSNVIQNIEKVSVLTSSISESHQTLSLALLCYCLRTEF